MRMLNLVLTVLFQSVRALGCSRSDLILENLALRQQIAVLTRMKHRPRFPASDRLVCVSLRRSWRRWRNALVIVKPETVVAWHRKTFRRHWASISRRPGRPRADGELRQPIVRMASENPSWGAPRIHGELSKLGFDISERSVSRYLTRRRPGGGAIREWVGERRRHASLGGGGRVRGAAGRLLRAARLGSQDRASDAGNAGGAWIGGGGGEAARIGLLLAPTPTLAHRNGFPRPKPRGREKRGAPTGDTSYVNCTADSSPAAPRCARCHRSPTVR